MGTSSESWAVGPDHPGGVLAAAGSPRLNDVAALMVAADGRYLMQLRDDRPSLRVADHWCLFGGRVEPGETPRAALIRELAEELEFSPRVVRWFTETGFVMPQLGVGPSWKTFFEVPITQPEIDAMVQHEGADRQLFALDELLRQPRVVPWDVQAIILHARRDVIFGPVPSEAPPPPVNPHGNLHHSAGRGRPPHRRGFAGDQ